MKIKNNQRHVKSRGKEENLTNPLFNKVSRIDESQVAANVEAVDEYPSIANNNLGCGEKVKDKSNRGDGILFICGVPNGNGEERLCTKCDSKLKKKWDRQDRTSKDPRIREIYKLRKEGKLNY